MEFFGFRFAGIRRQFFGINGVGLMLFRRYEDGKNVFRL
jgi:hypothetical protein